MVTTQVALDCEATCGTAVCGVDFNTNLSNCTGYNLQLGNNSGRVAHAPSEFYECGRDTSFRCCLIISHDGYSRTGLFPVYRLALDAKPNRVMLGQTILIKEDG